MWVEGVVQFEFNAESVREFQPRLASTSWEQNCPDYETQL
jgi:hypothetical protein